MRTLLFMFSLTVLAGCSDFNNFYEEKKAAHDSKGSGREVVAIVGPEEITKDEITEALNMLPYKQRKIYQSSPEKMNEYLDSYINQKVLYSEALKRGIDRREEILEKTENFKKQLVGQALGQEILKNIEVSESEIQKYHEKNKRDFERINISKIFIKTDSENGITKQDALMKARSASDRAEAGDKFEDIALEFSDDPASKKRGGKVGYINRGQLPPEIEERIFDMKEGEISKPLEVEDGFYIIKVDEGSGFLPDGQVRRKIKSELINEKLIEYVNGLREEWSVVVFKDKLQESVESD